MVKQCALIFSFLAIGEAIVWGTGIKLPSSIIGMLLLTASLKFKIIKLRDVEGISNFLVKNMGFFFVPAGVAIMSYFGIIKDQFIPIVVASTISTIIVIVITGWVHQITRKFMNHGNSDK